MYGSVVRRAIPWPPYGARRSPCERAPVRRVHALIETVIDVVRMRAVCHQPAGTNKVSPGKSLKRIPLAWSNSGKRAASGCRDRRYRICWTPRRCADRRTLPDPARAQGIPSRRRAASGTHACAGCRSAAPEISRRARRCRARHMSADGATETRGSRASSAACIGHRRDIGAKRGRPAIDQLVAQIRCRLLRRRGFDAIDQLAERPLVPVDLDDPLSVILPEEIRRPLAARAPVVDRADTTTGRSADAYSRSNRSLPRLDHSLRSMSVGRNCMSSPVAKELSCKACRREAGGTAANAKPSAKPSATNGIPLRRFRSCCPPVDRGADTRAEGTGGAKA